MSEYFPSLSEFKNVLPDIKKAPESFIQFAKNKLARTDNLPVDETLNMLRQRFADDRHFKDQRHIHALAMRTESVSDLEPGLYRQFCNNPTSIANWFPSLKNAVDSHDEQHDVFFLLPKTKILRLPHELAQYIRIEYPETTRASRGKFNEIIFSAFKLEDDTTYFIKTGTFSSKFEFANAKCSEPREMGEYFQVINNFAMEVGAGRSVDLCVREYIEDMEDNPTIYHGMPLRTEFRAFVDLDKNRLLGVTPHWHPSVMEKALALGESTGMSHLADDYETYMQHKDELMAKFDDSRDLVADKLTELLPHISASGLSGQWSVDVMKNGKDFYIIDMALMCESALTDLLKVTEEYSNIEPSEVDLFANKMIMEYEEPAVEFSGFYDSTRDSLSR